uniref:PRESAN domain-containing protein n=1 Tax=Heterorhabditis bacteriophora TaxID=37862 RepID=A0A1I7WR52_HETBA
MYPLMIWILLVVSNNAIPPDSVRVACERNKTLPFCDYYFSGKQTKSSVTRDKVNNDVEIPSTVRKYMGFNQETRDQFITWLKDFKDVVDIEDTEELETSRRVHSNPSVYCSKYKVIKIKFIRTKFNIFYIIRSYHYSKSREIIVNGKYECILRLLMKSKNHQVSSPITYYTGIFCSVSKIAITGLKKIFHMKHFIIILYRYDSAYNRIVYYSYFFAFIFCELLYIFHCLLIYISLDCGTMVVQNMSGITTHLNLSTRRQKKGKKLVKSRQSKKITLYKMLTYSRKMIKLLETSVTAFAFRCTVAPRLTGDKLHRVNYRFIKCDSSQYAFLSSVQS